MFALLHLLPMSDHGKDVEILALRHQIGVLERQLDGRGVRLTPGDRVFLAALLRRFADGGAARGAAAGAAGHGDALAP
jgi:hypothetical protein